MSDNLKIFKVENHIENENVILLHGYGANGRDLVGIANHPELKKLNLNWYFLEAPLSPPELSAFGGKAWFNLRVSDFTNQTSNKDLSSFYEMDSNEFKESFEKINSTIWNLDLKKETYLGGFSQGAMMAANCFLKNEGQYKGLITLSGAPFQKKSWIKNSSNKRAFVSHGAQDSVLPLFCGTDLSSSLEEAGMKTETHWFNGGHEIPYEILTKLSLFLAVK